MRHFNMRLDRVIRELAQPPVTQPAPPPEAGSDPTKDPTLAADMKTAEKKATASAQANAPAQQPGQTTDPQMAAAQQAQAQKAQAEQQKQQKQGQQLGKQLNDMDKEILQGQAKVTGGAAKPADIAKLNTQLTAKQAVQKQFMKNYGVNPG